MLALRRRAGRGLRPEVEGVRCVRHHAVLQRRVPARGVEAAGRPQVELRRAPAHARRRGGCVAGGTRGAAGTVVPRGRRARHAGTRARGQAPTPLATYYLLIPGGPVHQHGRGGPTSYLIPTTPHYQAHEAVEQAARPRAWRDRRRLRRGHGCTLADARCAARRLPGARWLGIRCGGGTRFGLRRGYATRGLETEPRTRQSPGRSSSATHTFEPRLGQAAPMRSWRPCVHMPRRRLCRSVGAGLCVSLRLGAPRHRRPCSRRAARRP